MLPLDDPLWSRLTHAYGNADDIRAILKQWESGEKPFEEIDRSLFNALVHQWDASDAAYAALPHIVRLGQERGIENIYTFFVLVAGIEVSRSLFGSLIPMLDELRDAYVDALESVRGLCFEAIQNVELEDEELRAVLATIAASKGNALLAHALIELTEYR